MSRTDVGPVTVGVQRQRQQGPTRRSHRAGRTRARPPGGRLRRRHHTGAAPPPSHRGGSAAITPGGSAAITPGRLRRHHTGAAPPPWRLRRHHTGAAPPPSHRGGSAAITPGGSAAITPGRLRRHHTGAAPPPSHRGGSAAITPGRLRRHHTVGAAPPHPIATRRAGARPVGAAPPPSHRGGCAPTPHRHPACWRTPGRGGSAAITPWGLGFTGGDEDGGLCGGDPRPRSAHPGLPRRLCAWHRPGDARPRRAGRTGCRTGSRRPSPVPSRPCSPILDGLGWEQLDARRDLMPTLTSLVGGPISTVAPTTTATALCSIATGLTPAEHGLLGTPVC